MNVTVGKAARNGARMLDRAEGILMGLRRCSVDAAFDEILSASRRHGVPTLSIARALVALADGLDPLTDPTVMAAARLEWSALFERRLG